MNVSKYFTIDYLLQVSAVTDLVDDRIYPRLAPVDVILPCIVVKKTSESRGRLLSGDAKSTSTRLEIVCIDSTDAKMELLKSKVIEALHGMGIEDGGVIANYNLVNDADIDDDLEESFYTGSLEFDVNWQY